MSKEKQTIPHSIMKELKIQVNNPCFERFLHDTVKCSVSLRNLWARLFQGCTAEKQSHLTQAGASVLNHQRKKVLQNSEISYQFPFEASSNLHENELPSSIKTAYPKLKRKGLFLKALPTCLSLSESFSDFLQGKAHGCGILQNQDNSSKAIPLQSSRIVMKKNNTSPFKKLQPSRRNAMSAIEKQGSAL